MNTHDQGKLLHFMPCGDECPKAPKPSPAERKPLDVRTARLFFVAAHVAPLAMLALNLIGVTSLSAVAFTSPAWLFWGFLAAFYLTMFGLRLKDDAVDAFSSKWST